MYINPESQMTHGKDKGRQVTFLLKDMFCAKVTTEEFCKDNLQCALLISEAGVLREPQKYFAFSNTNIFQFFLTWGKHLH